MTRFMSPDAPSMVRARDATSNPIPPNASDDSTQIVTSWSERPAQRHAEHERAEADERRDLDHEQREPKEQERREDTRARDIGVAMSRLSSFFFRASTMAKPMPQIRYP